MKKTTISITAALVLMMMSCGNNKENKNEHSTAVASDTATTAAPAPADESTAAAAPKDSAAMAKAWESYMTPGDMHKWMSTMDGKWDAELIFWAGPGAQPTAPAKAKVDHKTILGGRYQEAVYSGKMNGMDFEGRGMMAYDNAKKKFISTWIDNMGTGLMYSEGTMDDGSKTINMTGTSIDPISGQEIKTRSVTRIVDDKNQVMEMYCTEQGQEYKNMEIRLSKK